MSKIALSSNPDGTGVFTIASPNSNSDRTLNLPDNSGTVITTGSTFAGTGPAFSAYNNTNQAAPSSGVWTKLALNTELFDTNSNFSSSRFTPTVAGYYQVQALASLSSGNTGLCAVSIYKNGSVYQQGMTQGTNITYNVMVSTLVFMNGSTDYIEAYVYVTNTTTIAGGAANTTFSGALVRAA
jgi:hypothetical protein